jgi:hypothetical protein
MSAIVTVMAIATTRYNALFWRIVFVVPVRTTVNIRLWACLWDGFRKPLKFRDWNAVSLSNRMLIWGANLNTIKRRGVTLPGMQTDGTESPL